VGVKVSDLEQRHRGSRTSLSFVDPMRPGARPR
jgi:hypothetical protein